MRAGVSGRAALVAVLCASAAAAQAPQVTARVSPDSVGVGEPILVELRVRAPAGSEIRFPALPDSVEAVEPLDPRALRDASTASILDRTAVYRLIAWDTGQRVIAFGDITVERDGAVTRYPVRLPAIRVRSVLPADSARRVPREAQPLVPLSGGWWRVWLGAAVLALLALLAWRGWRQHRARRAALPPAPHVTARRAFAHAARLGLLEAGEHGRHALAHVDVMRRYLVARFPEAAASQTAREMADRLAALDLPILPDRVRAVLVQAEPIAFARAAVSADEARALAAEAEAIVHDVERAIAARERQRTKVRRRPL